MGSMMGAIFPEHPESLTWYVCALPPGITYQTERDRERVPASVPCPWNSCRVWRCSGHPVGTPQGGELRPHVPTITWHTSSGQQPDLNLRRDHGHTETPT